MTKDDLMANFDAVVTDRRLRLDVCDAHLETLTEDAYLFDRYHVIASGGSTGRRGVFVYDWDEWTLFYIGIARYELWQQQIEQDKYPGPLVMAAVTMLVVMLVIGNLIADLLLAVIDPRIRVE